METKEEHMTFSCMACGKRYRIDKARIRGSSIRMTCRQCGNALDIDVSGRPEKSSTTKAPALPDWVSEVENRPHPPATARLSAASGGEAAASSSNKTPRAGTAAEPHPSEVEAYRTRQGLGIAIKFVLFALLPLITISLLTIILSINRTLHVQGLMIEESNLVVEQISENLISQISSTVARQTRQYLFSHPDLRKEDMNRNIYFKKVALQNVGITGSTALYEVPGDEGAWRYWAHVDPRLVGVDISRLRDPMGKHFGRFWKIVAGVRGSEPSSGTFMWPMEDGGFREVFMACTSVEGTPYVVSASIFVDEFTLPLRQIEAKGTRLAYDMRNRLTLIQGMGLLVISLIIFFYGRHLTARIKVLCQSANRISMGELNQEIHAGAKDEIGELAEAVSRMQDSIRLFLERIRSR